MLMNYMILCSYNMNPTFHFFVVVSVIMVSQQQVHAEESSALMERIKVLEEAVKELQSQGQEVYT